MFECGDQFEHLHEVTETLRGDIHELFHSGSFLAGGHAAADVLHGMGEAMHAVTDGVCMEGFGEHVEALGTRHGEVSELAFGVIGESVEGISEVTLGVAEPLVGLVANFHQDAGDALQSAVTAIEHAERGEFGEAAHSALEIIELGPDLAGDVASGLLEVGVGTAFEVVEGGFEVGGEILEGVGELTGLIADENSSVVAGNGLNDDSLVALRPVG